jgi:hypothetical protein
MNNLLNVQTFGCYQEIASSNLEYLTLSFSPTAAPRKQRWRNNGLSADFLGDYFATFFPGDRMPQDPINRQDTVKAAVSYIANELLENAMKYSDESIGLPVSITLHLYEESLIFEVINHANSAITDQYKQFINKLLTTDIDELYTKQLEIAALGTDGSHMGLLTMINDYSAQFGWKFQPLATNSDVVEVTVMSVLTV